jgi:hypothetical protein
VWWPGITYGDSAMSISFRTLIVSLSFLSLGVGAAQAGPTHSTASASARPGHVATLVQPSTAAVVECKNPIECSSRLL